MEMEELLKSNFYKYYTEKAFLTENDFEQLLPFFEFRELSHNQYILRAGEVCKHFLFVEEGL